MGEATWQLEDGVSPRCLEAVCRHFNISCYAFDATHKCFTKYVATSRHHDALVYYSVNGHMYWVSDREKAISLVRKAGEINVNLKSVILRDEAEKENIYEGRKIFEDVPVELLGEDEYRKSVVA